MRLAILSDTHFGDSRCALVINDGNGQYRPGPKYSEFKKALGGKVKYLVLAGDVFDFSIAHYEEAYGYARAFFQWLKDDDLAESIVYLAGNHDADMWYIQLHQVHVIKRVVDHRLPKEFRHAVPAIIDDRQGADDFRLHGISRNISRLPYGGLFLDRLTMPTTNFNFAFPNLYIVTEKDTVLVTHGQYLETYWSCMGEMLGRVAGDDLGLDNTGQDISVMVQLNYPLNQLACTGIGQAGIFTDRVVRPLEVEIKSHQLGRVRKYLKRLAGWIAGKFFCKGGFCCWCRHLLAGWFLSRVMARVLVILAAIKPARGRENFVKDEKQTVRSYYLACLKELEMVNRQGGLNFPCPNRIIYGHTHQPSGWRNLSNNFDLEPGQGDGTVRRVTLHNTGGWLYEDDTRQEFCGAEIFLYESGVGFSSVKVS